MMAYRVGMGDSSELMGVFMKVIGVRMLQSKMVIIIHLMIILKMNIKTGLKNKFMKLILRNVKYVLLIRSRSCHLTRN